MSTGCLRTGWIVLVGALVAGGCWRESPPEIPDYIPRVAKPAVETPKVEVAEAPAQPVAAPEPKPEAPPPPKPVVAAKPIEAPPPPPPAPAAAREPTIVGTWKAVEMSQGGNAMPANVSIQFTFEQDGTLSMSMSMEGMPESQTEKGTYTLNGDQITISIENDAKTGTLRFEGESRVTLEVAEVKIVLERM